MPTEEGPEVEPTPSSPTESPVEEAPQQIVPQESPDTQTQDELPEGVTSDHAKKRFQQLNTRAVSAEQALEDLRQRKSVFDEFMPPQPQTPQGFQPQYQPPQLQQYTDEGGNVDLGSFDQAMQKYHQTMQMGTQQAAAQAQQLDRRLQEREAYAKYPDLNPVAKEHDDDFKQLVATRMAMKWAKGEAETLIDAADYISKRYAKAKTEEGIAKQAVEQYKEAQINREQGPVEKGRAASRDEIGVDKLKEISRKGSEDQKLSAMAERLKRAGS